MSQQHMDYDEMHSQQNEAPYNTYQAGYQEPFAGPSYTRQKLSTGGTMVSAGQRLALAIVLLCLLIPLGGIITGLATSLGGLTGLVSALIAFAFVCITIIAVNYFFNRSH